jgi:antitoxin (DNA-binding transcriptional repressor) of toxin-antitoxin stability system
MATKTVDIRRAKPEMKKLLSQVAAGMEIVFTEDDHPIARLVSVRQRIAGLHSGAISTTSDFDQSLPDEFWMGTE